MCRARVLRPAAWLSKEDALGMCHFSPEAFPAAGWLEKGIIFYASKASQREGDKTADEAASAIIAGTAAKRKVLRGWTRAGQPPGRFTSYSLTYELDREPDEKRFVFTAVYIANRKTDTLYTWILKSPRAEWQEVEPFEDTMLRSLQLDPEF